MSFSRVFVDGNVIIDLFDEKRKNHTSSKEAIRKLLSQGAQLMTSSDLITTIYYVLSKIKKKALADIEKVLQIFSVIPFGSQELTETLNLMKKDKKFKDLEDTLQYVLAKAQGCELILTNDVDFYSPGIKILTSEEVLKPHDS